MGSASEKTVADSSMGNNAKQMETLIVGIGFAGVSVRVGANAKAQFRIFVDHLAFRRVVVDMGFDECVIFERFLDQIAHFLSSRRAGILFEDAMTLRSERIKRKAHDGAPFNGIKLYNLYKSQ